MTTTELHTLAEDPHAFDAKLFELHTVKLARAQRALAYCINDVFRAAGARQRSTRQGLVWDASYDVAYTKVRDAGDPRGLLPRVSEARFAVSEIEREIEAMDEVYARAPWQRYWPCLNANGHIHSTLNECHTVLPTTRMGWRADLSGLTIEQAVAKMGPALCTHCFKDAPAEYKTKNLTQVERERTAAERAESAQVRDAAKAAKLLTPGQVFRTQYGHEPVTTVAGCLSVIRQAVEQRVEVEWINQPARDSEPHYTPDMLARMRQNRADSLAQMEQDAIVASAILIEREAAHEGHGMTSEGIAKIRASKLKSARKEWGL